MLLLWHSTHRPARPLHTNPHFYLHANSSLGRLLLPLQAYGVNSLQAYGVNSLPPALQKVLEELAALGLVQLQKGNSESWYIPTKLASNLSASLSESSDWQSSEGFVVVETNFKVYAYTSSKLQTEILRCFARLEYQMPNLVVGALTKESVNTALASGISAEHVPCQIIRGDC
ncbi:hypothetical protein M758_UG322000 [Ceratodon purpureus]|nr:hypothetical protein M758_UG322000 [Ceratodon purpureus]